MKFRVSPYKQCMLLVFNLHNLIRKHMVIYSVLTLVVKLYWRCMQDCMEVFMQNALYFCLILT